ncbi:MAG: hypothetical protein U1U88_001981 [Lawsonella clevelandensis]
MDLGAGDTKVLIVGTPTNVDMPDLQLYLIYSLAGEERTLNLFNTTLFSGGDAHRHPHGLRILPRLPPDGAPHSPSGKRRPSVSPPAT